MLPRTSGGFRLISELGRGGMGVVYEAEELASGRRLALKVLAAELAVSGEAYERFRREARIAAAIADSHCVFIYGAHEIEGSPAIAMELCGGETLERRLSKKEPVPIETAVRWTLEILEGLEAAHAAGIVHRDVKPSNCFTTEDGHVKIGDFGLSRSLERDVRLTQSGSFLGSPLYASPEQVRGREVDIRSDLYSCGATLYALLTGRPPYEGSNVGEVLARILSESPPPPRSIRPAIPRALEKIVLRAMERDPAKRFRDHASFREALTPFAHSGVAPGGLVRRFLAFMIDSSVLSIANFYTVTWLTSSKLPIAELDPSRPGMYKSVLFQLWLTAQMALYFALLEGLCGATLGKWLVGQRVMTTPTNQISFARAALRATLFHAITAAPILLAYAMTFEGAALSTFTATATLASYTLLWSSMRKRNGWRGLHDFASGMRVVQLSSPFSRFRRREPPLATELTPSAAWPAEIGGLRVEGVVAATTAGTFLRAHDSTLDRTVWIHALDDASAACSDARRSMSRPARLRWLDRIESGGRVFEVFEAPGGASLSECLRRRDGFDWPLMARALASLCDELEASQRDGALVESIDQMWIDRSWMVRVLDQPLRTVGERAVAQPQSPVALVGELARLMLPTSDRTRIELPPDLPGHAESCARRILGLDRPFVSLAQLRAALGELGERTETLTFRTRGAQIALAGAFPLLAALVVSSILTLSSRIAGGSLYAATYVKGARRG
jgi:uncharacterized RDD family membrane protein YckC